MKTSIISLLLIFYVLTGFAQNESEAVVYDSSSVELRSFDQSKIEEYKADPDYDYGNRPAPGLTLWQRFKIWLNKMLRELFYFGTETPIGKILVYFKTRSKCNLGSRLSTLPGGNGHPRLPGRTCVEDL